jgi:hypothetical protein
MEADNLIPATGMAAASPEPIEASIGLPKRNRQTVQPSQPNDDRRKPAVVAAMPLWPALISALCHIVLVVLLTLVSVRLETRPEVHQVVIDSNIELDVRQDVFDSIAPAAEPEPALRPPGGGPLRAADNPVPGDLAPFKDAKPELSNLAAGLANPSDLLAPGGSGKIGSGLGLGQGQGGGGGIGLGEAKFLGVSAKGRRFVYVIDRSSSMMANQAFKMAQSELIQSIERLSDRMEFLVVFYNTEPAIMKVRGTSLAEVNDFNLRKAREMILGLEAQGGTDHEKALKLALAKRPDAIFFLSDADDADPAMVSRITDLNRAKAKKENERPASIHVVQFFHSIDPGNRSPNQVIRQLAEQNNGTYRFIDTREFLMDRH